MKKIIIKNIKHIKKLEFDIPNKSGIYVLTGSNGSGKTTLMACLLRIGWYRAFQDNFKTGNDRVDYFSGEIIYQVNNEKVSYRHANMRWTARPRKNSKLFSKFGFPQVRFLPATGNRLFIQQQDLNPTAFRPVNNQLKMDLNLILETTKFENLRYVQTGSTRGRGGGSQRWKRAYVIKIGNRYYSEKNFSLGEILVLNTLLLIEDVPDNSMLLIDELELALHPRVQIRLLKFLEGKVKEKNLTVILSTHSSSIIKSAKRIIYLDNNHSGNINVIYNAYPALVLKEVAIMEDIQPDYVFEVEDEMAEMLLKEMLNSYFKLEPKRLIPVYKVIPIGGYKQVLSFAKKSHNYLFNSKIGQYIFLDKDVETTFNNLQNKNNRTLSEQRTYELFQELQDRINYLPITPEIGIWKWLKNNITLIQNFIDSHYQGSALNINDLMADTESYFLNNNDNGEESKKAKKRLKHLVKLISERVNEDSKRINQSLFSVFSNQYYSDIENIDILKKVFGRIFNKRGN